MSGRLSSRDYRLHFHSNTPAAIAFTLHSHDNPIEFFLEAMLILSPTYSVHEKYKMRILTLNNHTKTQDNTIHSATRPCHNRMLLAPTQMTIAC
jgi:hypothetical protein